MTRDCSLISPEKYKFRTSCVQKLFLFWHSKQYLYTTCSELVYLGGFYGQYFGLTDSKTRTSDTDDLIFKPIIAVSNSISDMLYVQSIMTDIWWLDSTWWKGKQPLDFQLLKPYFGGRASLVNICADYWQEMYAIFKLTKISPLGSE